MGGKEGWWCCPVPQVALASSCSCGQLSYPDMKQCCEAKGPTCKFHEAEYPGWPQGGCVPNGPAPAPVPSPLPAPEPKPTPPARPTLECSGGQQSYPDMKRCCKAKAPACKFHEAEYPTWPQGGCVPSNSSASLFV